MLRRGGAPAGLAGIEIAPAEGAAHPRAPNGHVSRLDAEGRTTVPGLVAQRWTVSVRESGFVPVTREVEVVAGKTVEAEIAEPEGGAIEVQVVDAEGRSRPFATVAVAQPSGVRWADLADDGTERLDRFVDHLGRRTLSHVEPGDVKLTATWAGRSVERTMTVGDGATARVRIEVP